MNNSIWVIGDVHGCYLPLNKILERSFQIDPNSYFWFTGDLVNRGPDSLKTLHRIIKLENRCIAVLGNHDLYLLAIAAGIENEKSETLNSILNAPDFQDLINWLRFRPLAHFEHNHLMVHAGVLANWDISKTLSLASEIENLLRSNNWKNEIKKIYKNKNICFNNQELHSCKNIRTIVKALTHIRFCKLNGDMDFSEKNFYQGTLKNLIPWFDIPNRKTDDITILFGHWSSLGLFIRNNIICLDTGCIWGKCLTAMRLHDRELIQVPYKIK
ncbi:MAG: symmetrical bis(5'-nucleosyl)-tetraphosphatase [Bordetella sp.]|nr:MAG: symmetrical bis(5'-nucleosyl)-tetraphosphatase [Bordetella sp.]